MLKSKRGKHQKLYHSVPAVVILVGKIMLPLWKALFFLQKILLCFFVCLLYSSVQCYFWIRKPHILKKNIIGCRRWKIKIN